MGLAIANECKRRGANIILVAGNVSVDLSKYTDCIKVKSTLEMYDAVLANCPKADYIIMAAAPSDYRVSEVASHKIKSEKLTLELVKNPDIAAAVGAIKQDKKLVIFSAETEDLIANAKSKLQRKNADMVVANDVTKEGAGFNVDTNIVSIISGNKIENFGKMTKAEVAKIIVDKMLAL